MRRWESKSIWTSGRGCANIIRQYDAGQIYGSTLSKLEDSGGHAGFAAAALTPTDYMTPYSNSPPLLYNPYPEYNDKAWKSLNQGEYVQCLGPDGPVQDVMAFSGHPKAFGDPALGSYTPLEIDSNLCFERETRFGVYGFSEPSQSSVKHKRDLRKRRNWDEVRWGLFQEHCVDRNSNRYAESTNVTNSPHSWNGTDIERRLEEGMSEDEAKKLGLHGMPETIIHAKKRTAVLLPASSGALFTESDKQNIRALIVELSLRSGGEYQVFILIDLK